MKFLKKIDKTEIVETMTRAASKCGYGGTTVLESTLMRILRRFMRMAKLLRKLFTGLTGHARPCILRITSFKKIS